MLFYCFHITRFLEYTLKTSINTNILLLVWIEWLKVEYMYIIIHTLCLSWCLFLWWEQAVCTFSINPVPSCVWTGDRHSSPFCVQISALTLRWFCLPCHILLTLSFTPMDFEWEVILLVYKQFSQIIFSPGLMILRECLSSVNCASVAISNSEFNCCPATLQPWGSWVWLWVVSLTFRPHRPVTCENTLHRVYDLGKKNIVAWRKARFESLGLVAHFRVTFHPDAWSVVLIVLADMTTRRQPHSSTFLCTGQGGVKGCNCREGDAIFCSAWPPCVVV